MISYSRTNSLNEFVIRKLVINNFNYPSKMKNKKKDGVSMNEDPFIIYLSPKDAILSRGVRRLVSKSV
jgi:hypothetical protein